MANKTIPTDVNVQDFIAGLSNKTRRNDAQVLIALLDRLTGLPPVMWGPTIIGYGQKPYSLAGGKEGIIFHIGFAPRSTGLVIYPALSLPAVQAKLAALGAYKTSTACLYIKRLEVVNLAILEDILRLSFENSTK